MKKILLVIVSLMIFSASAREFKDVVSAQAAQINRVSNEDLVLELPRFVFSHTNTRISIRFKNPQHDKLVSNGYKLHLIVNGNDQMVQFDHTGAGNLSCTFRADNQLSVLFEDASFSKEISVISIWYMVLPLVGLFLFLGYKLTFGRKKFTVISNAEAETEHTSGNGRNPNLKLVREEEEVLA